MFDIKLESIRRFFRGLGFACLLFVFGFALAACSPAPVEGFVQLPDPVRYQITALVVAAVGFVVAKLVLMLPFLRFLEEFRDPIALGLAVELIALLENALPSAYPEVSLLAVQLVLAVLAALRAGELLRRRGVRFFK